MVDIFFIKSKIIIPFEGGVEHADCDACHLSRQGGAPSRRLQRHFTSWPGIFALQYPKFTQYQSLFINKRWFSSFLGKRPFMCVLRRRKNLFLKKHTNWLFPEEKKPQYTEIGYGNGISISILWTGYQKYRGDFMEKQYNLLKLTNGTNGRMHINLLSAEHCGIVND